MAVDINALRFNRHDRVIRFRARRRDLTPVPVCTGTRKVEVSLSFPVAATLKLPMVVIVVIVEVDAVVMSDSDRCVPIPLDAVKVAAILQPDFAFELHPDARHGRHVQWRGSQRRLVSGVAGQRRQKQAQKSDFKVEF